MARDDIDARGVGRTPSAVPPATLEQMAEVRDDLANYESMINAAIAVQFAGIDADVWESQSDIRESMNAAIGAVDNSLQTVERVPTAAIDRLMNGVEKSLVTSEATLGMEGVSVPLMADEMRRDLDDETGGALVARLQGQDDYWQAAALATAQADPTNVQVGDGTTAPAYTFLPRPGESQAAPVQVPYVPPALVPPTYSPPPPPPDIAPSATDLIGFPPDLGPCPDGWVRDSRGVCVPASSLLPPPGSIVSPPALHPPVDQFPPISDEPPSPPAVPPLSPPCIPLPPFCPPSPPPPCGCPPKPGEGDSPGEGDEPVSPPPPASPPLSPPLLTDPKLLSTGRFDTFLPCYTLEVNWADYKLRFPYPNKSDANRVSAISDVVRWSVAIANSAADSVYGKGDSEPKKEAIKRNYVLQGDWFGGYSQVLTVFDQLAGPYLPDPSTAFGLGVAIASANKAEESSGFPLGYLATPLTYSFQAANPQFIPSQAEVDAMYLRQQIPVETWTCWTKMHGNIPNLREQFLLGEVATLTPGEAAALELRGPLNADLAKQFWQMAKADGTAAQTAYRQLAKFVPGPADLVRFMVRDSFDQAVIADGNLGKDFDEKFYGQGGAVNPGPAAKWAMSQGMTEEQFKYFWYSHWEYPSNTALYEMMHRLRPDRPEVQAYKLQNPAWNPGDRQNGEQVGPSVITRADAQRIVEINDLAPAMVKPLLDISYHPINRTDGINAFLLGAFTSEQLYHCFRDNGYNDATARTMVGIQEATAARRITNLTGTWSVRRTIKAYQEGSIDRLEANQLLQPLLIDQQKIARALDDADLEVTVGVRRARIAKVRRGYFTGATNAPEVLDELAALNIAQQRAQDLVATWTEERLGRYREPSAKQVVSWLQFGVINVADCVKRLRNLGYTEPDIEAMTYQGILMWSDRTVAKLDKAQARLDKVRKAQKDQKKETEDELKKRRDEIEKQQKQLEKQKGDIDKELGDRLPS